MWIRTFVLASVYLALAACAAVLLVVGEGWLLLVVAMVVAIPFFILHSRSRRPRWCRPFGFPFQVLATTAHQRMKIFVIMFVNLLLFVFGLLTYHAALERYGEHAFALLARYGEGNEGSRRHTAVVLFGDRDLETEKWPVPYDVHQRILKQIRLAQPRALMIDLLFLPRETRESRTQLAGELEAYKTAEIPVFLAESVHRGEHILEDFARHTHLVAVPRFVAEERHNLYPFFYPFRGCPECVSWHPTAATALYDVLCARDGRALCGRRRLTIDDRLHKREMLLIWGRNVLVDPWTTAAVTCDPSARFRDLDCPFTPTVSVTQLRTQPAESARLIRGRVVFYGAHISNSDLTRPPMQEPLPGVYAHAMAFDNLLTYGTHYKREARTLLHSPHFTLVHLIHLLIVLTVPIVFLFPTLDWLRTRRTARAIVEAGSVCAALATVYVSVIAVYEFTRLDIVPSHWIASLLEVAVSAFAVEFLTPALERLTAGAHRESESERP
jgi:CHASE2 domain-containing sensor protein